jgi:DNA-binding transcriptional regulator YiaG
MKRTEITAIRKRAGLSKSALARILGRSYRTILRWEDEGAGGMSRSDEIVLELLDKGELPQRFVEKGARG